MCAAVLFFFLMESGKACFAYFTMYFPLDFYPFAKKFDHKALDVF